MSTWSPKDTDLAQKLGRRFMQLPAGLRPQALREAAELFAPASEDELQHLFWWWEEGTRNVAESTDDSNAAVRAIRDQVSFHLKYHS